MRIVIDLQSCQSESRFRGIGRYSNSLTKAIVRNAGEHEIWIALSDRFPETIPFLRNEYRDLVPNDHIVTYSIPGSVQEQDPANTWRVRTSELLREHFLASLNPDVVHVSSLFEGWGEDFVSSIGALNQNLTTSVTLYDLIPFVNQESYLTNQEIRNYYYRKIEFLKNANLMLAISEHTKQESINHLGISEDTIINILSAADTSFQQVAIPLTEKEEILNRFKISKSFILYVPGGFDERKNFSHLIKAFSSLPYDVRSKNQLVITGKIQDDSFKRIIKYAKDLGLERDKLIFTDFVTNQDLVWLYNLCNLFVFPSLYEGFGLPLLEAISCGAVAIASNTTSLPEILERRDALFDPTDEEDITTKMVKALTDEGFRNDLRNYGIERAKKFSWDVSAQKAIAAFECLINSSKSTSNLSIIHKKVEYQNLISAISKIDTNIKPTKIDLVKTANCIAFNNPKSETCKMLVDISVLEKHDAKSGIQRVVRSVLLELLKSPPKGFIVKPIYFDGLCFRYANRFVKNFLSYQAEWGENDDNMVDFSRNDIYLGLDLGAHLINDIHDFLRRLNILGIEVYFIVYDILLERHPEWWPKGELSKVFHQWLVSIVEVSNGLICISRSVAEDVKEWVEQNSPNRVEPLPIGYFHLGADIENSAPTLGLPANTSQILTTLKIVPSFLMVGTIEPRKGYRQVLSAFEILWNQGERVNLVIVGRKGWLVDDFIDRLSTHPMLGKHLFWLEGISDEFLDMIYENSSAVIMASEGEGFGLPIIEAAAKNIPLILRDLPVFVEIAGENACYFSGNEPEALANTVLNFLELFDSNSVPESKKIKYLTWNKSVEQLLNVIIDKNWTLIWEKEKLISINYNSEELTHEKTINQDDIINQFHKKNDAEIKITETLENEPLKSKFGTSGLIKSVKRIPPFQVYKGYEDQDINLIKSFIQQYAEIHDDFIIDGFSQKTLKKSIPFCNSFNIESLTLPVPHDSIHAEALEYFALCDSIKRSTKNISIVELGAGWGPWISLGGVISRNKKIETINLIGVEASPERFYLMKQQLTVNGLRPDNDSNNTDYNGVMCQLIQGAISPMHTNLWFPKTDVSDMGAAVSTTDVEQDYQGRQVKNFPVIGYTLKDVIGDLLIDFLHIDIQGTEFDVVESAIELINSQVRAILIGTHSRVIEGKLINFLYKQGWHLFREKPCRFNLVETPISIEAMTVMDGIQYWRR